MTRSPTFGGVPDRVRRGDWLLVQWVATAKPGDPFPEPWCHAHAPLKTMIGLLAELGVIAPPGPGADVATIAREASAAARRWLETHPEPPLAPQSVPRRMTWGPLDTALQRTDVQQIAARRASEIEGKRAAAAASVRVARGAREFVLRAEQLQLSMVVEHEYEVQTRRLESDAVVEYRRRPVRATAMWRLNTALPAGEGALGLDPASDEHYVTRDQEVRVSAARWDAGPGGATQLRFAPSRPIESLSPELAVLLIDKMAQTLVSPQRREQTGEPDGRSDDGPAAWIAPFGAPLPAQDWTRTVLT